VASALELAPTPRSLKLAAVELAIAIAANVVLGIVLLGLFVSLRSPDSAWLASSDDALMIFRQRFPDAVGLATVASDGQCALLALPDGIGLLHRHGRRWNARKLVPGELSGVAVTGGDTITLALADFGWPRTHIRMDDPDARSAWLARLGALAAARGQAHPAVTRHA
jgi:hypothetical protein